jgi:YidC/Oxa1 family membrane protein insertase
MGFDRNTVIGFALLAVLFMGYFWYVSSNQKVAEQQKKHFEDSVAALKPKVDSVAFLQEQQKLQEVKDSVEAGDLVGYAKGAETFTYVENNLVKFTFSNKGGWLKQVELKNFKGPDSSFVKLGGGPNTEFGYAVNTSASQSIGTEKLYFNAAVVNKTPDGAQTVSYQASAGGKTITHSFVIKPDDYMVDAKIDLVGTAQMIGQQAMSIHWNTEAHQQQHDVVYEKTQTKLVYRTGNDYDYNSALSAVNEKLEKPTQWIGLKQQFFNSTFLSKSSISNVQADVLPMADTVHTEVATLKVTGTIPMPAGTNSVALQLYNGPNDYYILKKYDNEMFNIVDLGSGMFSFVKYINRWLILPVFQFLTNMMGGAAMGWAILVLTIIIRLLIAPLTYTSYLSGAKMKALRPEIEAMKARVGDDQQKVSMEQMKLFREAGVNPLGGCIPALFQIPIFFALYSFFNANIDLRGVPFLWSHDLSSYDSILDFSFTIPFYGNHVSLFTITACLTSFLISMYSMSTTPDTGNPMMKYMPYIFPFMMLFIFNKLPSALTWYYTVSNAITLILQFVIQNYIIDHKKILAQIAANRAAPKKKSKIAERMEAMQESQRKLEEMKKKTQGKK